VNDADDAYLHGLHSPLGWSTLLYCCAAGIAVVSVLVGVSLSMDGIDSETLMSPEGLNHFVALALVCGGLVAALLLAGVAALLRWAARTMQVPQRLDDHL
jgi:hypothetical protein